MDEVTLAWCLRPALDSSNSAIKQSYNVACGYFAFKQNLLAFPLSSTPTTFRLFSIRSRLATLVLTA